MRKYIHYLLVFFCSITFLAGCQKDPAAPPEEPSAIFELLVPESVCFNKVIDGSFLTGKLLTGNEKVQTEVVVSRVGKWSFSTDTLNGFSFAGSGMFADTGKQVITLEASGTPMNAGNYFFSVAKDSLKRRFLVSVLKSDTVVETVPLKSYFKGTIDGTQYYVESPLIGPDDVVWAFGGNDTVSFGGFVSPGVYPNPPGTGTLSLGRGYMYHYLTSTEADFKAFFKTGNYPYITACGNNMSSGISLFWAESDNEPWGTLLGTADQGGSSFTITGIEDGYDSKGIYFMKVKSRFNCKLYHRTNGQVKDLIDGEAVTYFKRK